MYSGGVMPGRRAGSGVGKYNTESPKKESKRFNSVKKTIHFAHLCILFIYAWEEREQPRPRIFTQKNNNISI